MSPPGVPRTASWESWIDSNAAFKLRSKVVKRVTLMKIWMVLSYSGFIDQKTDFQKIMCVQTLLGVDIIKKKCLA